MTACNSSQRQFIVSLYYAMMSSYYIIITISCTFSVANKVKYIVSKNCCLTIILKNTGHIAMFSGI